MNATLSPTRRTPPSSSNHRACFRSREGPVQADDPGERAYMLEERGRAWYDGVDVGHQYEMRTGSAFGMEASSGYFVSDVRRGHRCDAEGIVVSSLADTQ